MTPPTADMDAASLAAALPDYDVRLLAEVSSTQDAAMAWLADAPPGRPGLVVASRQTLGRGRGVNRWVSDTGCLTVTFVLPAPDGPSPLELPLRAGLAVRGALSGWVDVAQVQIKWPNDVWLAGRKVAGILCQRERGHDLIGIGLNVALDRAALPAALADHTASLHEHVRPGVASPPGRQAVLVALAASMRRLWCDPHWCDTLNAVHALTGRDIVVHTSDGDVAGLCVGVDDQGRLLVRTGQTLHHLLDGTVRKPHD